MMAASLPTVIYTTFYFLNHPLSKENVSFKTVQPWCKIQQISNQRVKKAIAPCRNTRQSQPYQLNKREGYRWICLTKQGDSRGLYEC